MANDPFSIALISEVFHEPDGPTRLAGRLQEAKAQGATLAVLPELPLNPWSPATKNAREEDAEPPHGPRSQTQAQAARDAGIGLVGGAIVRDPDSGRRLNTALLFSPSGDLLATYAKLHIPEEPGFWESSHYEPGLEPPAALGGFPMPLGIQICSDANRPEGSHLLGAMGAGVILVPRATEQVTYPRWRVVFRANALTCCCYVLSVNRPRPELDVLIGGPSIAVDPNGQVLLETTDPVGVVQVDPAVVEKARIDYPGYLAIRAPLYARAWSGLSGNSADEDARPSPVAANPS